MTGPFARLFGALLRLDPSVDTPPWRIQIWNKGTAAWESIGGVTGATGASGPTGSLLVRTPNPYNFVDSSATDHGQPPDFVVLSDTQDVIAVGGM